MFIPYITILSDSEDEDTSSSATTEDNLEDSIEDDPSKEDSFEEDLTEEDEPLLTKVAPTPPTHVTPTLPTSIIQLGRTPSYRPYKIYPNGTNELARDCQGVICCIVRWDKG
ncbi:hypothetical protein Tco_0282577 [Tanacetum coccineum]